MKRAAVMCVALLAFAAPWLRAHQRGAPAAAAKPLTIYVVDVEGGKATLFVTPTGQSLLIDTGFPGTRDTDRILAAVNDAGLKQLDYLLITHYHVDHAGNALELAKRIPVGTFVDHGPTVEGPVNPALREQVPGFQQAYAEINAGKHLVVKPGDKLPITGVDWRIVTSAGNVLKAPMAGAGAPNPACASFTPKTITNDPENAQSVGSVIAYGQFRALDLGDLLWNKEFELMCPNNPVGTVDLFLVSHHGIDISNSDVLVHAARPRVALMQNGPRKGGAPSAFRILHESPRLEDIWQTHWSIPGGAESNSPGLFIANTEESSAAGPSPAPGTPGAPATPAARGMFNTGHEPAYWLKITALPDGSFAVVNPRNSFSKTYGKK
jgi:beta-lactamase superfamily II metal-dependent hydrolase